MIHNFERWRLAKMQTASLGCLSMRYYRIDLDVVNSITALFQSILILRVEQGEKGRVSFPLSDDLAQVMMDFCEQCEYGYIHPRSTSARMRFVAQNRTANPSTF